MSNYKILLAPTREIAESLPIPEASIEAEYGDFCVRGSIVTLAHHGSRSHNPAPCNTPDIPVLESGVILISHIDLDTIGGILALMGQKPDDQLFWEGAELIDIKGLHHKHELSEDVQSKLNAYYAYVDNFPKVRYTGLTDVTDIFLQYKDFLLDLLNPKSDKYASFIKAGKEWGQTSIKEIEDRLIRENQYIRCFNTDGVFCAASYYSPGLVQIVPATVSLNTANHSITIAFEDGGIRHNAVTIAQSLWGKDAGGRAGIAGSPRNWSIEGAELFAEFEKCCRIVEEIVSSGSH